MKHECKGNIYYQKCIDCAVRLLLTTKGKQEEAMLAYLSFYHGHSKDELTFRLDIARLGDPKTSA
jgi:hypothetical protein